MTVTKKDVNAKLRDYGYGNIKMSSGGYGGKSVTFRDYDGKMVKGVKLASHSPMNVTNAATERTISEFTEIANGIIALGFKIIKQTCDRVTLHNDDSNLRVVLYRDTYPTYSVSAGYDRGYVTDYLMVDYPKSGF